MSALTEAEGVSNLYERAIFAMFMGFKDYKLVKTKEGTLEWGE
jgi:hypothetical protein